MILFSNLDRATLAEAREDAECEPCDRCDCGEPCAEPHAAPYDHEAERIAGRARRARS